MIGGHAQISMAAARQDLIVHEKTGTATRVKGGWPGLPDTWNPAGEAAPAPDQASEDQPGAAGIGSAAQDDEVLPVQVPGTDGTGEPAAEDGAGENRVERAFPRVRPLAPGSPWGEA